LLENLVSPPLPLTITELNTYTPCALNGLNWAAKPIVEDPLAGIEVVEVKM
jgi:hypothetical protein